MELFFGTGVKLIADVLKDSINRWLSSKGEELPSETAEQLRSHQKEVLNWSDRVQFYGMAAAKDLAVSIPLELSTPKRYRGPKVESPRYFEHEMLADGEHILLLGAPGAGKTTTMKRLASQILTQPITPDELVFQFPVVIRLSEIGETNDFFRTLLTTLGLSSAVKSVEIPPQDDDSEDAETLYEELLGTLPLKIAVAELLDQSNVLLLVDGLDESKPRIKEKVKHDLEWLGLHLNRSKIIVTCRSGDHYELLEGFKVLEICPLSSSQEMAIAEKWLGSKTDEFFELLGATPYRDLASRPLLLAQVMNVFDVDGFLPDQPCEVYARMIKLLLEDWDKQRRIHRLPKYASFTLQRKLLFLAALAYELTVEEKTKSFTEKQLIQIYSRLHKRFGLPESEALEVARDIETHGGLITQTSRTSFEFCHLSFQEYLCAEHLVRDSFPDKMSAYLQNYSAPIAVAVAISSNPTNWLGGLFLRANIAKNFTDLGLRMFMERLLLEQPILEASPVLGLVASKLYFDTRNTVEIEPLMQRFTSSKIIREALAQVLQEHYEATQRGPKFVRFKRVPQSSYTNDHGFQPAALAAVPYELLGDLFNEYGLSFHCEPSDLPGWKASSMPDVSRLPELTYD